MRQNVNEEIVMKLIYQEVKSKEEVLKAMTSLTQSEFEKLAIYFEEALQVKLPPKDPRKGGRPPHLQTIEDQLFFILFYFKTYPLQEVLGYLFGMDQSQANEWIYKLTPVLHEALKRADCIPARKSEAFLALLTEETESQNLGIDGTERRINRPQEPTRQTTYYSGKKKAPTVKNDLIAGLEDRHIKYLSETCPGRVSDKKIADQAALGYPKGASLYQDKGFQGYAPPGVIVQQPKKKPKGGDLTNEEAEQNRLISRVRIAVEHVIGGIKRMRIVKDVFRNQKLNFEDLVMEVACGLHNFRTDYRLMAY
jgi:hypothetical protein